MAGASWAVLAAAATPVAAAVRGALARTEDLATRAVKAATAEAKAAVATVAVLGADQAVEVDSGDESHSRESNRLTIQLGRWQPWC